MVCCSLIPSFYCSKNIPHCTENRYSKKEYVLDTVGKVKFEIKTLASLKILITKASSIAKMCCHVVLDHEREVCPGILSSPNEINILGL